jgi:hypothetical protein
MAVSYAPISDVRGPLIEPLESTPKPTYTHPRRLKSEPDRPVAEIEEAR